jgi:hypothetical protein
MRSTALAFALVVMACGSGSRPQPPEAAGPAVAQSRALTVTGVSFAGTFDLEESGAFQLSPPRPIDGMVRHWLSSTSYVEVRFFVPAAVYGGPGTYECGAEPEKLPGEYAYCSISLEHVASRGVTALWTTQGAPSGVYGPLPGCTLVVAAVDGGSRSGHVTCPALPYATSMGGDPDAGKPLAVTAAWSYRAF